MEHKAVEKKGSMHKRNFKEGIKLNLEDEGE